MKKRKNLLISLLAICVTTLSFGLFACDSDFGDGEQSGEDGHVCSFIRQKMSGDYLMQEANCTLPALYYYSCECGKKSTNVFSYGEALGHTGGEATEDFRAVCERCYQPYGDLKSCEDIDKNHLCDNCGETLSRCADEDADHLCDFCGDEISSCIDKNKDHNCDICEDEISDCVDDADGNNVCDVCGKIRYTFILIDQAGDTVVGARLSLVQDNMQVATGTTDADGKISGTIKEGSYVVKYVELPEGYFADDYMIDITLSASSSTIQLSAINNIPNGTAARPFVFIGDAYGYMSVVLPANELNYYLIPRPMGRNLIVSGKNFEVIYNNQTYLPTAGVTEEIVFTSAADDAYATELIALRNLSDSENEIKIGVPVPLGSSPEVAIEADLDSAISTVVNDKSIMYYKWTATANGTLACEAITELGSIYLYNENTYRASDTAASVSIAVNEGDTIYIMVGLGEGVSQGEVVFMIMLR